MWLLYQGDSDLCEDIYEQVGAKFPVSNPFLQINFELYYLI